MGAWDIGSFDNDAALDFVADINAVDDLTRAFESLGPAAAYADADNASEAIAAADLVAAMMGRPAPGLPHHLAETVTRLGTASDGLIAAAVSAVRRVRANSELAELWAEAEEEDWEGAIDDLLNRLDPALPYTPPPPGDGETFGEIYGHCLLCGGSIPEVDAVTVKMENDDGIVASSLTLYAHPECLEKQFSAPHFTEDGQPHPDLLAQVRAHLDSML